MSDVMTTTELPGWLRSRYHYTADQAVTCPKCKAGFARACQSTGGGNPTAVPTHKVRTARVEHWTGEQRQHYGALVWEHRRHPWEAPADVVAEAEAAAKPIPAKPAKQPTPKGVRLSENQAEEIERAAANNGKLTASTGHFHGDAAYRQTIHALRDKGILAEGPLVTSGWEREYTLTDFGWQVYLNHRLIIRNDAADHWAALNQQERR